MAIGPFSLELMRPVMLIIALVVMPWLVWCWHRSLVDLSSAQQAFSLVARMLVALCLILSLAGLSWMRPTAQKYVVVLVDQSLSVGDQVQQQVSDWLGDRGVSSANHRVVFLPFAAGPGDVHDSTATMSVEGTGRQATNIELAVETAVASIPPFFVPELMLVSDGNQTAGDALRAAAASGVPISVLLVPDRTGDEVQVAELNAAASVSEGEPFVLEMVVDSSRPQPARIDIFRDDIRIEFGESAQVQLQAGENRFRFRQVGMDRRSLVYTGQVHAEHDTLLDNNQASAVVTAEGKPRVLLVDSDLQTTDTLRWALEEQSLRVDLRPAERVPSSLAELQNYDAVILSNVPATSLSLAQMQALRTFVRDLGGGLIAMGGDQAFGLGGYYKTTLDEMLPVRSDFEKEKEKPSLAMVLIVDRSGSMGGAKLELAKDAARGAVELLGPRDQVGVIAFDIETYWVSELHSAADQDFVVKRISTLAPGGGTNMYPAMMEAYRALQTTVAKLKHVIILTDGISSPGDFTSVTADMASQRITVSTVGVGDGADEKLLEQIAEMGQGRFYLCADPQSVPQIFAKETMAASRSAINELPFFPHVVRATPVLAGIDLSQAPPLLGFVATRPKPTSEVVLTAENGEPLLAWWRFGLGMTVAFTSDAKSRWASEWLSWPEFPRFWAQVVRSALRNRDSLGGQLEIRQSGDQVEVTLDAADASGEFRNRAPAQMTVVPPGSSTEPLQIPLEQTAPGRYAGRFPADKQGAYLVDVRQEQEGQLAYQQSRGVFVGYPNELRLRPNNVDLLRQLSASTGGLYNPTADLFFTRHDRQVGRSEALWPYLLMTGLLLFLVDVALRRLNLEEWKLTRLAGWSTR